MTIRKIFTFFMLLSAGLFSALPAGAQDEAEESHGPRPGLSVGGRAAYSRPKGADHGDFAEGAQVRYHLTRRWALEGSVDLRREKFSGTKVSVVPIQLSVLVYLMPHGYRFAPYILAGGGWYYTQVDTPADSSGFRFGPHAGAGVEFFRNSAWSFGGSYRYLWTPDIHSQDAAHPLGRNLRDEGFMLTAAVNYSF
ncbi:MAG: porin family protein [Elusimicrobiales bacterium]|nr:porin family protein [Elusimicrobiales bacterium]